MVYDVIGSREKAVAIIEKSSIKKAKEILKKHKNIKTVLAKESPRKGKFRIYKLKYLAGEKNIEIIHKEYGYRLKLNPRKVYFSPREAEERQRIVKLVKDKEKILTMFSGVSPFAIAVLKKKPNCKVTCIELNPKGVEYANENVKLNKINPKNIKNICGDVKKVKLKGKFDRIRMPLPEIAYQFLDVAFKYSKKGTIIHLYGISDKHNLYKNLAKLVKKHATKKYRIKKKQKVANYSPGKYKVRLDILVNQ